MSKDFLCDTLGVTLGLKLGTHKSALLQDKLSTTLVLQLGSPLKQQLFQKNHPA